ncbi:PQQ-dependent sugar dehydrogenase [Methylobacterium sp. Leaf88]|uniref:PQQ-dependent sugar dehydrogenase n=1 Tax=Methylobacterium sp. Leaf88 TaxID=1736244 RepID=UPI0006F2A6F1|nr:PQQ-dependent sugar dehydrogenase [Methylobacterium sp. Leaf88]KQO76379.1 hypothetical protein ASF20_13585 [Methylobacterium sp. Leaf88]
MKSTLLLAATLLAGTAFLQATAQESEPGRPHRPFAERPPVDPAIVVEKASRDPFVQPHDRPIFPGLPPSAPVQRQPAPRDVPPEGQALERRPPVNPTQQPAFPGQTRAVTVRTKAPMEERVVARGLSYPWSLAFMPDGRMLVTEKSGTLRVVTGKGEISEPVDGVPPVMHAGDCGLLAVLVDPDFASNRLVYLSFVGYRPTGHALMVVRGRLSADDRTIEDVEQLLTLPPFSGINHYAGGMVIGHDGKLYLGTSEWITDETRIAAQLPASPMGKILRINRDGSIPADNPYVNVSGAEPRVWSIGHRDPEGLALDPKTGGLWISDHGPQGGDEIDRVEPGHNYGWPLAAYGKRYDGGLLGGGRSQFPGTDQPAYYWDPAIAPAGIAFYTADLVPEWKGNLFVSALGGRHLARLVMEDGRVTGEERLLRGNDQRVRDVKQAPDGALWVVTDDVDGRLIRLSPKR